jgi:protease II
MYKHFHFVDSEATSADGTKVPYTIIYTDRTPKNGNQPTLVIAYGAYGYDIEPPIPAFAAAALELGVVTVLVHARGGRQSNIRSTTSSRALRP